MLHSIKSYLFLIPLFFSNCSNFESKESTLVELGQHLFFETGLSINNTKSCASCHDPQLAFTDGYRTSVTALGEKLKHNSPSILNCQSFTFYDWANLNVKTMAQQIKRPLYGKHPIELGLDSNFPLVQQRLMSQEKYRQLFKKAFGSKTTFSLKEIETSLLAYEQRLISTNSKFDSVMHEQGAKFTIEEMNGFKLFMSPRLKCISCHQVPFKNNYGSHHQDSMYANIGLFQKYPNDDNGLLQITKVANDEGKFKIPTLRNVAITGPYMHDGSVSNLEEVIDIYARGGRQVTYGPWIGDGKLNVQKDKRINGFSLSQVEKSALIQFLNTLTDTTYLENPLFTNPHKNSKN